MLRSRGMAALLVALLATAVAVVGGLLGWRWMVLAAVVVAVLAELRAKAPGALENVLLRAGLDRIPRAFLRMFAVLALLAVSGSVVGFLLVEPPGDTAATVTVSGPATAAGATVAFGWVAVGYLALTAALAALLIYVLHNRTPIALGRNLELPLPDPRPAPPRGLTVGTLPWIGLLELAVVLPAVLAPDSRRWTLIVGGLADLVLLLLVIWLAAAANAVRGSLRGAAFRRRIQRWLDDYSPEVLVYFGGRKESAYQLHVWLTTLERVPERTLVLLRDPKVLEGLPATGLPVLCVPGSVDLMALNLDTAHVALFAANVGNSLHVLRLPHLMTVFIGHGDSDKSASSSPFAKAYDEIWVAGPAARERYRRAQVGVRDDDIVEVGRPQLDALVLSPERADGHVPTLLYAPTWEGWNAEQHYTSVDSLGPELVAAVLADPRPVRVIYKPHPFTGRRDARIARAHNRIVAMLEAANATATGESTVITLVTAAEPDAVPVGLDGAFTRSTRSAVDTETARAEAETAAWAARHRASHAVVGPDGPSLFSCFDQADALLTDVSSVLTDFMATGRPYAVTNPTAVPVDTFVEMFPAAGAGVVVGPGQSLAALLDVLTGTAPDERGEDRARLRAELLGPPEPPATERFCAAVADLARRGREREAAHEQRGVLAVGGFDGGAEADD